MGIINITHKQKTKVNRVNLFGLGNVWNKVRTDLRSCTSE